VPTAAVRAVFASASTFAMPKSRTFTIHERPTTREVERKMFAGLRSR
jgi:hypothetical protein